MGASWHSYHCRGPYSCCERCRAQGGPFHSTHCFGGRMEQSAPVHPSFYATQQVATSQLQGQAIVQRHQRWQRKIQVWERWLQGLQWEQPCYTHTPDGRELCFAFNAQGCSGKCGRVHACRVRGCYGKHSAREHQKYAGNKPNQHKGDDKSPSGDE